MKLKLAVGITLLAAVCSAADAAPPAGLSLGPVLTTGLTLLNTAGPLLNPVLQPVLAITAPAAGPFVASLHPTFVAVGQLTGALKLPALPGLPQ